MHRRQFLASLLVLPFTSLFQFGYTIGGWYVIPDSTCTEFRVIREGEPEVALAGIYTFQYDYPVDDNWLDDFRESTAIFGCKGVYLPLVVNGP